ncbi:hypothetical protein EMPS_10056 [Entomortierella parvispora]|uniref:Uncharacterized protein n=1 Tax=Entomortierella parvispora TaxID=205924 RepID=A0A9P3HJB3_9FUNG|nr:hypothetical protein EMPS_10056 [Entomortierella parvispora]
MNRPTPSVSLAIDELDEQIYALNSALIETRALKESQLNGHLSISAHPLVLSMYMLSQNNGPNLLAYRKALARGVFDLIEEKRRFMQSLELSQRLQNSGYYQQGSPLSPTASGPAPTMMLPPGYKETTAQSSTYNSTRHRLSQNNF